MKERLIDLKTKHLWHIIDIVYVWSKHMQYGYNSKLFWESLSNNLPWHSVNTAPWAKALIIKRNLEWLGELQGLINEETKQKYSRKKNGWYSVCSIGLEDKIPYTEATDLEKAFMALEIPNTQYDWYKVTMEELEDDLRVDYNEWTREYSWECWGTYEGGFRTIEVCGENWEEWANQEILNSENFVKELNS